jgi:hypothetical protein
MGTWMAVQVCRCGGGPVDAAAPPGTQGGAKGTNIRTHIVSFFDFFIAGKTMSSFVFHVCDLNALGHPTGGLQGVQEASGHPRQRTKRPARR